MCKDRQAKIDDLALEIARGRGVSDHTREKLQEALELEGVEFIQENGGGPGVRLRNRQQKKG